MAYSKNIKSRISQYKIPLIHVLVWAVIFLLPIIFAVSDFSEIESKHHNRDEFFYLNLINKLFKVGLFYLNTQWLIPRILYPKKYLTFILSQVVLFMVLLLIDFALFKVLSINHTFHIARSAYHNASLFLFISLASITFKTLWDKSNSEKIENERQKENLRTELSFLRSQISPHFIFNILNNIVAMVRLKSDGLEDTVVKLSTLLQYMLYETDEEKVLLHNEAEYLESYVDLQSQRFGSKIQIIKAIEIKENWHIIEPMLLIPFVENAFKHGYGMVQNPTIEIKLQVIKNQLFFEVKNRYNPANLQKDKVSGIGLTNVKRRLELLYPDKHQLAIWQQESWFMVSLKLQLKA